MLESIMMNLQTKIRNWSVGSVPVFVSSKYILVKVILLKKVFVELI